MLNLTICCYCFVSVLSFVNILYCENIIVYLSHIVLINSVCVLILFSLLSFSGKCCRKVFWCAGVRA